MENIIPLETKTKLEILAQAEKLAREMFATHSIAQLHAPLEEAWALFIVLDKIVPDGLKRVQFLKTEDAIALRDACRFTVCTSYGVLIDSFPVSKRLMATSIFPGEFPSFQAMVLNGFADSDMNRWGREIEQRHVGLYHGWMYESADPVARKEFRQRVVSSRNSEELRDVFKNLWHEVA